MNDLIKSILMQAVKEDATYTQDFIEGIEYGIKAALTREPVDAQKSANMTDKEVCHSNLQGNDAGYVEKLGNKTTPECDLEFALETKLSQLYTKHKQAEAGSAACIIHEQIELLEGILGRAPVKAGEA